MYEPKAYTLPEVVEESSRRYADRPALAMVDGETVRYAELEPRTRRIAAILGLYGIRKGDRVAILSDNRPEWGIAYFGLSRAGAIAIPIMVDFPQEQIANILDHSESKLLFVSRRFQSKISSQEGKRIILSIENLEPISVCAGTETPESEGIDAATLSFSPPEVKGDDLAAILYTSGTTGHSKGVMLTHRNFVFDAIACRKFIILRRTDRLLSILPLAHAYEFCIGFLIPMLHGSAVYYLDKPPSATALLPALKAVRPTVVLSVPLVIEKIYRASVLPALEKISLYSIALFRPILERIAGAKLMHTFGGKIRFFGIGGAPLAADVESFLKSARFPYSIGYGLTETAPMVAGNRPGKVKVHTTGFPADGVEIRIADPRPDTGEGEIQVRGQNVMPGYYRDPERTKEVFSQDGWFRTGDLGCMDAKGRITVRGRLKTMILGASGENIYPEEIEALLNASPYVLESIVYGDDSGLTALVHLKPEVMEELTATIKDSIEEAEDAAMRLGAAVEHAVGHAGESIGSLEKSAAQLLERIKKETNAKLAAFSRIGKVRLQVEPFEKTPKQSIKRFLYPKHP
jgi:long-chain acyl-CoA synthetase